MDKIELQKRTKAFHINEINTCFLSPKNAAVFEISKQIILSAGSVGANCSALARAKSTDDFTNKVAIIIEEADESLYWREIIHEVKLIDGNTMTESLIKEANELTAIFVAISKTTKARKQSSKS